tara:strand:- start:78 stop:296 length:219 start_codon:yes stop_codon:yes gene_type:complete
MLTKHGILNPHNKGDIMSDATHTVWSSTQGAMVPVKLVATREPSYGATVATVEGEGGTYDVLYAHLAPIIHP